MELDNKKWSLTNFCELDKFAIKSYCAIHDVDESQNLGDITTVDENALQEFTMICGGSPCQDFSVAGKQAGSRWRCNQCGFEYNPLTVHYLQRGNCPICNSSDIDKTRSSLLVEWLRIIRANMPDWAVYENVKNIVGKKFKETFDMFISELNEYGYNTYYQVLNAKDYGIPQNRERLYLIAIKKELDNGQFHFPDPIESDIVLKDILENNVDESYYVNTPRAQELISDLVASGKLDKCSSDNVDINLCGNLYPSNGQNGKVYSTDGIASAISAGTTDTDGNSGIGSNNSPKIVDTSNQSNGRG